MAYVVVLHTMVFEHAGLKWARVQGGIIAEVMVNLG